MTQQNQGDQRPEPHPVPPLGPHYPYPYDYPHDYPTQPIPRIPGMYPAPVWAPPVAPQPKRTRWIPAALSGALVAAVIGGGGLAAYHYLGSEDTAAVGECNTLEYANYITLKKKLDGEPKLYVPLTGGWKEFDATGPEWEGARNPVMRGMLVNTSIREDNYTPNATVTLRPVSGEGATDQELLGRETRAFGEKTEIRKETPATVCGYPAVLLESFIADKNVYATSLMTVFRDRQGDRWIALVLTQTRNPDQDEYRAQVEAFANGLRISFPQPE